ncbi:MAG: 4Fe-4S dicluster domain-containing protein [Desulfovibrionales bacterium]|nr:4Fe-4S dicluster domain-containing protein [Desulfovibrionales bacterium]
MSKFVVGNPKKCIGCKACLIACASSHVTDAQRDFLPRLTLVFSPEITVPIHCRQCENAPCASVCPAHAITVINGRVTVQGDRCVGCKQCVMECPFGAISVGTASRRADLPETNNDVELIPLKCDLCADCAETPSCVDVCPAEALSVVTASALEEMKESRRAEALKLL